MSNSLRAALLLVAVGVAFHLPRLDKPLGIADSNAGAFIGVFLNNWDDHGFAAVRGVPLWRQRVLAPDQPAAEPYLKHPPGLFWTSYALGTAEWTMRLPSMLGAILAAVCLFVLLCPHLGGTPAFAAGLFLLGTPSVALYSQASYETVALGMGLLLWVAVRAAEQSARWRIAAALIAFAGTWLDWSFCMFCLGLVALTAARSSRRWLARLLAPALGALAAAASVLAWQSWALRGPLDPGQVAALREAGLGELLRSTLLERPPFGRWLEGVAHFVPATASPALALAALAGVVMLARRAPKLAIALALAGAHFVVFANHGVDHPHFYCFQTALVAASCGALGTLRLPRLALAAGLAALAAAAWLASARAVADSDTTFLRDLGAELTTAARAGERSLHVGTNFWPVFPYYVASPSVYVVPVLDANALARHRRVETYRYLWFKDVAFGPGHDARNPHLRPDPALAAFFDGMPSERVPALEVELREACYRLDLQIREVRLVTVERGR